MAIGIASYMFVVVVAVVVGAVAVIVCCFCKHSWSLSALHLTQLLLLPSMSWLRLPLPLVSM